LDGLPRLYQVRATTLNPEAVEEFVFPIPDGWLQGIGIRIVAGTSHPGSAWARLGFVAGSGLGQQPLIVLAQGQVSTRSGPSWPSVQALQPTAAAGAPSGFIEADPIVGAEINTGGKNFTIQKVQAIGFRLVTSATVATRIVVVNITQPSGGVLGLINSSSQTATLTRDYVYFQLETSGGLSGTQIRANLPPIGCQNGFAISTTTTALQAGDQFSAFFVWGMITRDF
jgi:hypothetical protein